MLESFFFAFSVVAVGSAAVFIFIQPLSRKCIKQNYATNIFSLFIKFSEKKGTLGFVCLRHATCNVSRFVAATYRGEKFAKFNCVIYADGGKFLRNGKAFLRLSEAFNLK